MVSIKDQREIFVVKACLGLLALLVLVSSAFLFYRLDKIPYGYHVDEMSTAVAVGCMATEGVDAHNVPHPLFADMRYGTPKPPTYLYPATLWAKVFGYSVPSLRALSVTFYLLGVVGLFFLAHLLFGWRYAFLTVTIASISPWNWILCRTAFESLFAIAFLVWAMYFFLKPPKIFSTILSGLFFSAAMYAYPPFRMQMPFVIVFLAIYTLKKNARGVHLWLVFALSLVLPSIPLLLRTLSGELQARFNTISMFSKDYLNSIHSAGSWSDLIRIFINNYFCHFSASFLFIKGDPSLIHSTGHFGILSWLDMAGLVFAFVWIIMLFFKKGRINNPVFLERSFLLFLIINILIAVIPSALTTDLPNSLRIIGAWPFTCLLTGYFLWQACERFWGCWVGVVILAIIFSVLFLKVFFQDYPQESKGMFGFWTLEEANQLKTDQDWLQFLSRYRYEDYHSRYFLMQYRGLSCTQSRNIWEGMRDYLISQNKYY